MKAQPAAEAEKLIDKNDIIGNSAVDRSRQISGVNPLAGIEVTKTVFMQQGVKTKFETLQTVEETLFAN
jgi:hypothetical protein